ncbi:MAG: hypothetical protein WDM89_07845 [Rhizomicrobium sp.]
MKQSIIKIETGKENYFPGLTSDQIKEKLVRLPYKDYLLKIVKADPGIVPLLPASHRRRVGAWVRGALRARCVGIRLSPGSRASPSSPAANIRR